MRRSTQEIILPFPKSPKASRISPPPFGSFTFSSLSQDGNTNRLGSRRTLCCVIRRESRTLYACVAGITSRSKSRRERAEQTKQKPLPRPTSVSSSLHHDHLEILPIGPKRFHLGADQIPACRPKRVGKYTLYITVHTSQLLLFIPYPSSPFPAGSWLHEAEALRVAPANGSCAHAPQSYTRLPAGYFFGGYWGKGKKKDTAPYFTRLICADSVIQLRYLLTTRLFSERAEIRYQRHEAQPFFFLLTLSYKLPYLTLSFLLLVSRRVSNLYLLPLLSPSSPRPIFFFFLPTLPSSPPSPPPPFQAMVSVPLPIETPDFFFRIGFPRSFSFRYPLSRSLSCKPAPQQTTDDPTNR